MLLNPAVENDLSATSLDKKMSALWNSLLDCLECWYITNAYRNHGALKISVTWCLEIRFSAIQLRERFVV